MKLTENKRLTQWVPYLIGAISLLAVVAWVTYTLYQDNLYKSAKESAFSGDYAAASNYLNQLAAPDYKGAQAVLAYCEARQFYESGDIVKAHSTLSDKYVQNLTVEQKATLDDFRATVDKEYELYSLQEAEKKAKKEAQEAAKAAAEWRENGVPYVGMSEADIGQTSLGSPSPKVRHNYECIRGKQYLTNLYDFYSGKNVIFTARCIRGVVTQVWDDRNRTPYVPNYTHHTTTSDPYDVDYYVRAEDFYYDHEDDFFDYYDAENYYNEHHD